MLDDPTVHHSVLKTAELCLTLRVRFSKGLHVLLILQLAKSVEILLLKSWQITFANSELLLLNILNSNPTVNSSGVHYMEN